MLTYLYNIFYHDNSVNLFMDKLHDEIPNNISYVDFDYQIIPHKNKLYEIIEKYDISMIPTFFADFHNKYPNYTILEIKYIYCNEALEYKIIPNSLGVTRKKIGYTMKFSVYYKINY